MTEGSTTPLTHQQRTPSARRSCRTRLLHDAWRSMRCTPEVWCCRQAWQAAGIRARTDDARRFRDSWAGVFTCSLSPSHRPARQLPHDVTAHNRTVCAFSCDVFSQRGAACPLRCARDVRIDDAARMDCDGLDISGREPPPTKIVERTAPPPCCCGAPTGSQWRLR